MKEERGKGKGEREMIIFENKSIIEKSAKLNKTSNTQIKHQHSNIKNSNTFEYTFFRFISLFKIRK
jgi:hypothetical protein